MKGIVAYISFTFLFHVSKFKVHTEIVFKY